MSKSPKSLERPLSWLLVIGGIIGIICSFVISYDKNQLLLNPHFQPNCNLNPIVSCGSVMRSAQGSVFGFPNPWIGLVSFAVLTTLGVGMLAGAKFKRWFWLGLYAGCILGMVFAYWLLFESMFRIHALCPYCLTVDVVVTALFWYVTLFLMEQGWLRIPRFRRWPTTANFLRRHHGDFLLGWFLLVIAFILHHFWYYFGSHLF